jgi:hypothetical protein
MVYSNENAAELDSELLEPTSYKELIATVISSLKAEEEAAYESREVEGHTWTFKYGTVDVFVHLSGETDDDSLTVWSPVLKLPARDEAKLTKTLLTKNWSETLEARFSLWNDSIVLHSTRILADISPGEISRTITVVASLADEYDEPLQAEFGQ